MEGELNNLSKQFIRETKPNRESGDQKAGNEHNKLSWGWCMLQGREKKKKKVFQHMLIKTASYPSVDKPLTTDSK